MLAGVEQLERRTATARQLVAVLARTRAPQPPGAPASLLAEARYHPLLSVPSMHASRAFLIRRERAAFFLCFAFSMAQ